MKKNNSLKVIIRRFRWFLKWGYTCTLLDTKFVTIDVFKYSFGIGISLYGEGINIEIGHLTIRFWLNGDHSVFRKKK